MKVSILYKCKIKANQQHYFFIILHDSDQLGSNHILREKFQSQSQLYSENVV